MATTATPSNPLSAAATISGRVHGGNQPVGGAVVKLYYAGENGMGSGDPSAGVGWENLILAATATSANDGTGSFSFIQDPVNGDTTTGNTFSCPANNPIVYVVARGGNTLNTQVSGVNNAASAFIGAYGSLRSDRELRPHVSVGGDHHSHDGCPPAVFQSSDREHRCRWHRSCQAVASQLYRYDLQHDRPHYRNSAFFFADLRRIRVLR